jgi:hypothetical protein
MKIHGKLEDFRETTGYTGEAGEDWQEHKVKLILLSWKDPLMPALAAHRRLGLFVEESKKRGEWLASDAVDFANHIAIFYATLLQAPNISVQDLGG